MPGASCSVPQLEGVTSWLCWPQDLHIYTKVSLYREPGGDGLQACRSWASQSTQDSSSQVRSPACSVAAGAAGAPVVHVVCKMTVAQPPLLWPRQQGVVKTTSAQSTRKGHDAGFYGGPAGGG